jgi:pimeloyl-ACP methyl ester carboxylesterase
MARMTEGAQRCEPGSYAAAVRAVADYRWTAELQRVAIPALILQGLDDQLTPPGGAVKLGRALPRSRVLMIERAGHYLPLEQPDVFRAAVLSFTAGVDCARQNIVAEVDGV